MPKKKPIKKCKNMFFFSVLIKYQGVTHVSTSIFQGLFENRSVAF